MREMALVGLALALIGCAESKATKDRKLIEEGQRAVAAQLIDPTSPLFSDVTSDGLITVCGWVNGKNRVGAYAGKQRFVWTKGSSPELEAASDPAQFNALRPEAANGPRCMFDSRFGECKGDPSAPDLVSCTDWLGAPEKAQQ